MMPADLAVVEHEAEKPVVRGLKILLIEDSPSDALLIQEELKDAGRESFEIVRVELITQGLNRLLQETFDVVLLDLFLPDSQGLQSFVQVHTQSPDVPIVVLSGMNDESLALDTVKQGAQDYLVKGQVHGTVLWHAIRYAIERNQINQMKGNLISFVTHELRAPLGVIQGYAELLSSLSFEEVKSAGSEHINTILQYVHRLTALVRAFSDITKIESGHRIELIREHVDVRALVSEAVNAERMIARNCGFLTHIGPDVDSIYADEEKLLQVLLNLLSNADKYSPKGGIIHIHVDKHGDKFQFAVVDSGLGISKVSMKHLFTPFYRIHSPDRKRIEGSGLGLALSKIYVEAHGGEMWVESEPGDGSTFYFTLPDMDSHQGAGM